MTHEARNARKLLEELAESCERLMQCVPEDTEFAEQRFADARRDVKAVRTYLAQPVAQEPRKPDGYAYEYVDYRGNVIRFDGGSGFNGSSPLRAIPYWLGEPPDAAPAQAGPRESPEELQQRLRNILERNGVAGAQEAKLVGLRIPNAAPSLAAEDGLTYSLKQIVASNAVRADIRNTIAQAAAHIERQAQEIAMLRNRYETAEARLDVFNKGQFKDADALAAAFIPLAAERDAALRRAEALHTAVQSFRCGCALASELRSGCLASPVETK